MAMQAGLARKPPSARYFEGEKAAPRNIYSRLMYTAAAQLAQDLDLGHWADRAAVEAERRHSCSLDVRTRLRGLN